MHHSARRSEHERMYACILRVLATALDWPEFACSNAAAGPVDDAGTTGEAATSDSRHATTRTHVTTLALCRTSLRVIPTTCALILRLLPIHSSTSPFHALFSPAPPQSSAALPPPISSSLSPQSSLSLHTSTRQMPILQIPMTAWIRHKFLARGAE